MKKSNNYFKEILGQDSTVKILNQAVNTGKIFHSYIFSGPKGTQKTRAAYSFCKALLSEDKPAHKNIEKRVEDNNHPDIINILPDGDSIKISQLRKSLINDISIKPFEAKYKIYIIHKAHTMGIPAQNALLKTLEETPDYGLIILITDNISALLPTIISRSQSLQFKPLKEALIEEHLKSHYGFEEKEAKEISTMAGGSIENAIKIGKEDDLLGKREELLKKLLRIIKNKDITTLFLTAEYLVENKDKLDELLDFIMLWFRDVSLYKALGDNEWLIHKEWKKLIQEFSYYLSEGKISAIIEEVNISRNNRRYNVNLLLNMETMLLKIQEEYYV